MRGEEASAAGITHPATKLPGLCWMECWQGSPECRRWRFIALGRGRGIEEAPANYECMREWVGQSCCCCC